MAGCSHVCSNGQGRHTLSVHDSADVSEGCEKVLALGAGELGSSETGRDLASSFFGGGALLDGEGGGRLEVSS